MSRSGSSSTRVMGPQRRVDVEDLELRREVLVALEYHGVNLGGEHKKRTGREKKGGL